MRIKITRGTIAGGSHRDPGERVDLAEEEAKYLIRLGKAEVTKEAVKADQNSTKRTAIEKAEQKRAKEEVKVEQVKEVKEKLEK